MKLNYKIITMIVPVFITCMLPFLFIKCNSSQLNNSTTSDCKDFIEKTIYTNKSDSSNYMKIKLYCSGDTNEKIIYHHNQMIEYNSWFKSGVKESERRDFSGTIETSYNGPDTMIGLVSLIEDIGNFRHWNEQGILIYETHILPNRKEQRINRDSIGNVIKIDTISY